MNSTDPILIPRSLKEDVLCVGVKKAGQTVIFYNENREIPDVATKRKNPS